MTVRLQDLYCQYACVSRFDSPATRPILPICLCFPVWHSGYKTYIANMLVFPGLTVRLQDLYCQYACVSRFDSPATRPILSMCLCFPVWQSGYKTYIANMLVFPGLTVRLQDLYCQYACVSPFDSPATRPILPICLCFPVWQSGYKTYISNMLVFPGLTVRLQDLYCQYACVSRFDNWIPL